MEFNCNHLEGPKQQGSCPGWSSFIHPSISNFERTPHLPALLPWEPGDPLRMSVRRVVDGGGPSFIPWPWSKDPFHFIHLSLFKLFFLFWYMEADGGIKQSFRKAVFLCFVSIPNSPWSKLLVLKETIENLDLEFWNLNLILTPLQM